MLDSYQLDGFLNIALAIIAIIIAIIAKAIFIYNYSLRVIFKNPN